MFLVGADRPDDGRMCAPSYEAEKAAWVAKPKTTAAKTASKATTVKKQQVATKTTKTRRKPADGERQHPLSAAQ